MTTKKTTVNEFNKEFFNKWTKITKITPHFTKWTSDPEEDDVNSEWYEIERIDIEFEDDKKISIIPKSNRPDDEELCLALDIVQFKPETVKWRVEQ